MIDKLSLTTTDFSIAGDLNPDWNTSKNFGGIYVSNNRNGLLVSFNPAKLYFGHNEKSISSIQLPDICNNVQDTLSSKSVYVSIDKMSVSRIDLAINIGTTYSPSEYFPLFEFTKINYMNKRDSYSNGLYWHNKSRCLIIYDKTKELKDKQGIEAGVHLLRFEYRLLNRKAVTDHLRIGHLNELYDPSNYQFIQNIFLDFLRTDLFSGWDNNQAESLGHIEYLIKNKNKRNSIRKLFSSCYCKNRFSGIELKNILLSSGYSKKHISQFLKEINDNAISESNPEQYINMQKELLTKLGCLES